MRRFYNGWEIHYSNGPYAGSQCYKAYRFGVSICANSETLICEMIDRRGPTLPN